VIKQGKVITKIAERRKEKSQEFAAEKKGNLIKHTNGKANE
jgi:hypothetical protein